MTDFAPVAVLGYGCVFPPDGYDVDAYWKNLLTSRSGISVAPPDRWDWEAYFSEEKGAEEKTYCKLGGFVTGYEFPAQQLGIDPDVVAGLNRTQLMTLDTVLRAVDAAGYTREKLVGADAAVLVGNMLGDEQMVDLSLAAKGREIIHYLADDETWKSLPAGKRKAIEKGFFGALHERFGDPGNVPAGNVFSAELAKCVSRVLGLSGPALVGDAACAAALAIVDVAVRYLQDRTHSMVLACGVLGNMSVTGNVSFAKIGGLSGSHSSPLDASADGLIPGEGAGTLLLKRLDDAVRDGDNVVGVIRGVATRCDGKGKAIYAPSSSGQVAAMRRALSLAGMQPEELDHIETHATATPTGDATEVNSLKQLYEGRPAPQDEVTLGSVKALTGHTFSAAGMANLIKILLAFEREKLPPNANFAKPQPGMKLDDSPFRVPVKAEPWPRSPGRPRRVLANAFGFGGVNSSICVEQYDAQVHGDGASARAEVPRPAQGQGGGPPLGRRMVPLAVVGMGCVTPFARSLDGYTAERPPLAAVGGFPDGRWMPSAQAVWDAGQTWRGGVIRDLDFPWKQYRIPPSVVAELDRSQLMAVMAAGEALEDAGTDVEQRRAGGVFVGAVCGMEAGLTRNLRIRVVEYAKALERVKEFTGLDSAVQDKIVAAYTSKVLESIPVTHENALPGYMDNITAGRICNLFDVRGPGLVLDDDACSFGAAVDIASRYLEQGECSMALVGGVHANLLPEFTRLFARRLTEARPDGASAGDLVPAEAAVFFVLKPLAAVSGDERVHAVISDVSRTAVGAESIAGDSPFYFGAQGALQALDLIAGKHDSGEVLSPQVTGDSCGCRVHLTTREKALAAEDGQVAVPAAELAGKGEGMGFIIGETLDAVLAELERVAAGDSQPLPEVPASAFRDFRLGIAYGTQEELVRKANAALRLLRA